MNIRTEIQQALKDIDGVNFVGQDYPKTDAQFPCLIHSAAPIYRADHDGISYREITPKIELYAKRTTERDAIAYETVKRMMSIGYVHVDSYDLPHPDYKRVELLFRAVKQ